MAREIRTVGVVSLGTMGSGIVEVFARSGIDVIAAEVDDAALDRGRATLTGSTDRAVSRGKLSPPERDALLGRVTFAVGLDAFSEVDLVIEAVPEHLELKRRIFAELDRICARRDPGHEHLLAVGHRDRGRDPAPGKVVGMHFFNPAPVMKLVEVVRSVVHRAGGDRGRRGAVRAARQGRR